MNNFKLAALMTRVNLIQQEKDTLLTGLNERTTHAEQLDFFQYCKKWKAAPMVYSQIEKYTWKNLFEADILELFKSEFDQVKTQNKNRNERAIAFLKVFKSEGIEVIILKGNYLAHTAYKEVGYKRMNDLDILIRKEDWDRIQDVYLRLGYIPLGFGWSGEKEKPASFSHVGIAFISPDFSCIIGSQWGIKSPTTSYNVDIDDVWKSAKPFNFCGVDVKSFSPEYNLLHLILHMGVYKCGIRDFMDVYNLMRTEKIDEKELNRLIQYANAEQKSKFTMTLCNLCCPVFSEQLITEVAAKNKGFLGRRLDRRLKTMEATHDFQTSYNDYFQDIEKKVIYFNLFPEFHLKLVFYLKILRMVYFPKTQMALKLNDKAHVPSFWNKLTSAVKAPYFVFSLIAQEIGWKFTVLLFTKLLFDLLFSIKNYFIKSKSYFDYLKEKGIDPKEIEKVVKNIQ
jgi:hypothetical protein